MKYLLLLYDDPAAAAAMSDDERRAIVEAHIGYAHALGERGAYVSGEPVDDPARARTIRFDGPTPTVTDGPFLETKEAIGGFYVIDVPDRPTAEALAMEVPRSPGLVVELRPIPEV